ncbi:MAG: DUF502 domain-containing protein [Bacteroidota bacterium]|nr:DUF502 domain-containing protein [Bacteroidota bacterium]
MKQILRYFIQGLIITVPVAITVFVVWKLIAFVGSIFSVFGTIISPVIDPFIVIVFACAIIFTMGLLGSSIILRPMFIMFDNAMEHTPFIKTVYSSIKDLLSAFVGSKKRFNRPVLVTINKENNIQQLGFITQDDLTELNLNKGTVAVYVPLSYSFSGNLLIVPSDHITVVDASSSEVMKFIVSGGVTDIDE